MFCVKWSNVAVSESLFINTCNKKLKLSGPDKSIVRHDVVGKHIICLRCIFLQILGQEACKMKLIS